MKKSLLILFSFALAFVFYACTDPVVINTPVSSVQWQIFDSVATSEVSAVSMADQSTIFAAVQGMGYKFTTGTKSVLNFSDTTFVATGLDAYSTSYIVFAGRSYLGSNKTVLKIFINGAVIETVIIPGQAFNPKVVKVIEPGKIYVTVNEKVFYYNNGSITTYTAPDVVELYDIALQGSKIYFSGISGFNQGIYKLENNDLTRAEYIADNTPRVSAAGNIFKTQYASSVTNVLKWNGTAWDYFSADAKGKTYYSAAGNTSNFIYFIKQDSVTNAFGGSFWNGSSISSDENYRFTTFFNPVLSNVRNSSFCLFTRSFDKSILYKGTTQ